MPDRERQSAPRAPLGAPPPQRRRASRSTSSRTSPSLEDFVDDFAQARIADARAAGASWAEISERLGVTRQAAHKRFSGWRQRGRGIGGVIELRFTRDQNGS